MAQKNPADLLRAYLVVGTDELKRKAALTKLRTYVPEEWADFCIDELDAQTLSEPAQLIDSLQALPFGADIRLVILHNVGALTKEYSKPLIAYLKDPNPQTVLLCEGESLAKNTRLYKALAKMGPKSVIECGAVKDYQFGDYLVKLANSFGLVIDKDAAEAMAFKLGTSTVGAKNQLGTIKEIEGSGFHITKDYVEANVAQLEPIKPWDVADALCTRDVAHALSLIKHVKETEYFVYLSSITGRLRDLICAQALTLRGQGSQIATALKWNPKIAWKLEKDYKNYLRHFSEDDLVQLLSAAEACEANLKSSPDSKTAFISFIMKFAQ